MTKISPQAQAVITASNCAGSRIVQLHIAAALRAAALYCKRDKLILLSLADELEGEQ